MTWSQSTGTDGNPIWTQTTSLSPDQQKLYDQQNALSKQYLSTAQSAVDRVSNVMGQGLDLSKVPGMQYLSGPTGGPSFQTSLPSSMFGSMPNAPALTSAGAGSIQNSFDTSGVRALPGTIDDTSRKRVEDAIMSRLNPQYQSDEQALRTRLLNSGIEVGTDAYNKEMDNFGRRLNDARMQAVLAGGQEESRQVGLQQGLQAQEFDQAHKKGVFGQNADIASASNALQAAGINNQAALGMYNAQLAAQAQQFGQGLAAANFDNSWRQQGFSNQLQHAGFNNAAAQNDIQLQAYLRQLPLNEANALRSGGQVQGPQFGSYYTGSSAQAPQLLDAGIAQGNYNMQAAQNSQSGFNSFLGGMAQLGSAALPLRLSDPRLKTDITRVGTHPLGIGIYEYNIEGRRERGVMSTDVRRVMPDAVAVGDDGFDRVNYTLIGGV